MDESLRYLSRRDFLFSLHGSHLGSKSLLQALAVGSILRRDTNSPAGSSWGLRQLYRDCCPGNVLSCRKAVATGPAKSVQFEARIKSTASGRCIIPCSRGSLPRG